MSQSVGFFYPRDLFRGPTHDLEALGCNRLAIRSCQYSYTLNSETFLLNLLRDIGNPTTGTTVQRTLLFGAVPVRRAVANPNEAHPEAEAERIRTPNQPERTYIGRNLRCTYLSMKRWLASNANPPVVVRAPRP